MATRDGVIFTLQGAGAAPTRLPDPLRPGQFLIVSGFYYKQDGVAELDLTSQLLKLPAGKIEVYPTLSRFIADQMVATADLSLGHAAFIDGAGKSQAADLVKWASALDSGGGAIDVAWVGTDPQHFDTRDGLLIQSLVAVANIDQLDLIRGWVAWRFEN